MDDIFNERGRIMKFVFSIVVAVVIALPGCIALFNFNNSGKIIITILSLIFIMPFGGFLGFISAKHLIQRVENNSPITGLIFKEGILIGGLCGVLANIPLYIATMASILIFAVPVGFFIGAIVGVIGAAIVFNITRAYLLGSQRSFSQ